MAIHINSYPKSHFYSVKDLFDDLAYFKGDDIYNAYNTRSKARLTSKIFIDFLVIMVEHIIETGDVMILPTKRYAKIRIEPTTNKALTKERYKDLDIFKTGFKAYKMYLNTGRFKRVIHLDNQRFDRLIELLNNGKQY